MRSVGYQIHDNQADLLKAAALAAWAVLLIGIIVFVGWISGYRILSSFYSDYLPMSPIASILTITIGLLLLLIAYEPKWKGLRWYIVVVAGLLSIISFWIFLKFFGISDHALESFLFSFLPTPDNYRINYISPYSGLLFLVSGLAIEMNVFFAGRKFLPDLISSLGFTLAIAGFIAVLGYSFGTKVLYGSQLIPMAIPTAVVFLLFGIGLICISGPKGLFLRQFIGSSTHSRVLRTILPVVLSAIILEDLLDIIMVDNLHVNPALNLVLLTIFFSILTTLMVVRLTKNIFRNSEKAERELELQKRQFQQLFENSPIGIAMLDKEEIVQAFNKSFGSMFQFSADEILGKNINDFIVPAEKIEESLELAFSASNGINTDIETIRSRKDGTLVPVHTFSIPINIDDKQAGLYVMYMDISERKLRDLEVQIQAEIGHSVSTTSNLTELMKLIHLSIKKVIDAENCFFAIYDENSGLFSFPYFVDKFDPRPDPEPMNKSCCSYLLRTGKSLIITPQVAQQLREQNEIELVGTPSPSWIGVPLQTPSKVIGVLVIQHYEEENVYNADHLRFLDAIASQIANVIERQRSKEALEESLSLLTATFESTADGILLVDKNGKVSNFNKKFVELWQIPEAIILKRDDATLIAYVLDQLKDPKGFLDKVNELYLNNEEISFDILEFKDGRIYERYSQAQRFEENILGRVWSFRDVTVRKQFEKDLQYERYLFNVLMDNIPDHIYFKDEQSRFIRINKSHARRFGFSDQTEAIGKTDFDFFEEEHAQQTFNDEQLIISTGNSMIDLEEKIISNKTGKIRWNSTTKMPLLDANGKIIGTFGISHSITERKLAEESLKESEYRLRELNAAKDKFFSIISHDLKSPFNSIVGFSNILAEQARAKDFEGIEEYAEIIQNSSHKALDLLSNLLEWSRLQTGRMAFNPENVKIGDLINNAIDLLSDTARHKLISISKELQVDVSVFVDKQMIATILRNLISNAIKFTLPAGKIVVVVEHQLNELIVIVSDNGVGINADGLSKLFRIEESYCTQGTQDEMGTGLGLILCKEFIEKHGGKIWVESEVDKGSKFKFTLPVQT